MLARILLLVKEKHVKVELCGLHRLTLFALANSKTKKCLKNKTYDMIDTCRVRWYEKNV